MIIQKKSIRNGIFENFNQFNRANILTRDALHWIQNIATTEIFHLHEECHKPENVGWRFYVENRLLHYLAQIKQGDENISNSPYPLMSDQINSVAYSIGRQARLDERVHYEMMRRSNEWLTYDCPFGSQKWPVSLRKSNNTHLFTPPLPAYSSPSAPSNGVYAFFEKHRMHLTDFVISNASKLEGIVDRNRVKDAFNRSTWTAHEFGALAYLVTFAGCLGRDWNSLTMKSASHGGGIFPKEMCPGEQTKEQNTGESIAAIYREAVPEAIVQIARLEQAKLFLSDAYELQANSLQPEALELITAAAALGHPQGNLHLGRAYLDGAGITQNTDLALRHLNTAISRGATTAATILGDIYHNGKIGDINIQRAIHFYEIAMDGGDPWAAIKLAKVLETLKEDPAEAWNSAYDLLVNTGFAKRNPYAAFTCYEILAFGKGKKVDPLMANSHLNDASELGHEVAKSIVEKVSER